MEEFNEVIVSQSVANTPIYPLIPPHPNKMTSNEFGNLPSTSEINTETQKAKNVDALDKYLEMTNMDGYGTMGNIIK